LYETPPKKSVGENQRFAALAKFRAIKIATAMKYGFSLGMSVVAPRMDQYRRRPGWISIRNGSGMDQEAA
jgi:hypothetical protein